MMKSQILSLLRQRGDFISGQELCEYFGVSRTAVWKAVGQLKKEGFCIEAVQNRGYRLVQEKEVFCRHELESRMDTRWAGHPVSFYDVLDSTNLRAKLDAEKGAPHGALVVADMQTQGRGRRGRGWNSPAGTNLYFTLILKPDFAPEKASMLTLVMAMAVSQGIMDVCQVRVGIKWPNDIVVDGKKVCGMLTELSVQQEYIQHVVIGVGINVGLQNFPSEIAETAVCLEQVCGRQVPRASLAVRIMQTFETYYETFLETQDFSRLKEPYDRLLVNCGKQVRVLDPKGEYTGISKGIDTLGELLVELPDGSVRAVYAGEVSVRGIYGYV